MFISYFKLGIQLVISVILILLDCTVWAYTIEEALANAYASNPILLAAQSELRATDEQVPQAISGWRPSITIDADIGKVGTDRKTLTSSTKEKRTSRSVKASLSQSIYSGGRTMAEIRRSINRVAVRRARLKSTEQLLLLDAATAYLNVLREMSVRNLSTKNENRIKLQLEAVQDRFTVGEVTRTDVVQSEARLSNAVASRVEADGNLNASRDAYLRVIGLHPINLVWPQPLIDIPISKEAASDLSARDNPNVVAAQYESRAALDQIDLVFGELLPSVTLDASLETASETSSKGSVSKQADIIARLSVPLYQSGSVSARLRGAKQTSGQRQLDIINTRRESVEASAQAWEDLETSRAQMIAFTDSVRANTIALEGVKQEATVGLRTTLDVLDAEQELFQSKVDLVRARRDTIVAGYNLRVAIGTFTAAELALSVALYDVNEHYNDSRLKFWINADDIAKD